MSGSAPRDRHRRRLGRCLPDRCSLFVPAFVLGVWTAAGASDGGSAEGEMTPFLLAIAAILVAAKIGGELVERLNQPAVLGELLFGIVLGNIGLTGIEFFDALETAPFLAIAAEIGVILLLFQVGLESNLDELLAVGASAVGVAVLGVVAPVALGYAVSSLFMPDAAWYVHLFLGASLAATSVGITARVLADLGVTGARESRVILGAAIVDDVLGLILLAVVLGFASAADAGGAAAIAVGPLLLVVAEAAGFLAGAAVLGRLVLVPLMRLVRLARSPTAPVVLAVAYCFLMAALAELAGLADIVGAFVAGLVVDDAIARHFGKQKERYRIGGAIAPVSTIFVPVFFVYMGLQVDLRSFASPGVLLFAAVLCVAAVAGKQVCSLAVLEKGLNRWAVGLGMVPRGEVGLIFAGVGATTLVAGAPVFDGGAFAAIVAMVMVTTLATPPLLRAAFLRAAGGPCRRPPAAG